MQIFANLKGFSSECFFFLKIQDFARYDIKADRPLNAGLSR